MTADEFIIISGTITQIKNVNYRVHILPNDTIKYSSFVTAIVNTDKIEEALNRYKIKLEETNRQNKKIQNKHKKSTEENQRLHSASIIKLNELYTQATAENKTFEEILALTDRIIFLNPAFKRAWRIPCKQKFIFSKKIMSRRYSAI